MGRKTKLTDSRVEKATGSKVEKATGRRSNERLKVKDCQRAKPGRYADGGGLYLQVGDNSASWLYRWERDGRERWCGLGSFWDVSLDEARELARQARRLVKVGGDPIADKRAAQAQAKIATARTKTFRECATIYFNDRRDGWDPVHALQWSSSVLGILLDGTPSKMGGYCKGLLPMPVQMIDVPVVLSVVQPLWKTKSETARRVLNRIAEVLDWARAAGLRSGDNPANLKIIGKLLPKQERRQKGHASVPVKELAAVYATIAALPGLAARALQFCILTTTRTSETLEAKWSEILPLENRTWTIPPERMKGGVEHKVPLSEAAVSLLRALPTDGGDIVFLSAKPGQPMDHNALLRVLNIHAGRDETVHGMRACFSTWASDIAHSPPPVTEACLAHQISKESERSYKRGTLFDRRRQLMDKWASYCTTIAPPVVGDNAVPIVGSAR
jgi:integrase